METVTGLQAQVNSQAAELYTQIEPELSRLEGDGIGEGELIFVMIAILGAWKFWDDHFNLAKKINRQNYRNFKKALLENGINAGQIKKIQNRVIEELDFASSAKLADLVRGDKAIVRLAEMAVKKFFRFNKLTKKEFAKSYWGAVGATVPYASAYAYEQVFDEIVISNEWVVARPIDKPCYQPSGEIRKVGKRFSNGLFSPPVHPGCMCLLLPSQIHKKNFLEKYL